MSMLFVLQFDFTVGNILNRQFVWNVNVKYIYESIMDLMTEKDNYPPNSALQTFSFSLTVSVLSLQKELAVPYQPAPNV